MTREELAQNDGRDGRKAYAAVNGTIYDFSESTMWVGGDHQGAHQAGQDLTEELKDAPHVRAVIERFPVVGRLEEAAPAPATSGRGKVAFIIVGAIALAIIAFFVFK